MKREVTMICLEMIKTMRRSLLIFTALVTACATTKYAGEGLTPGQAGIEETIAVMGEPKLKWSEPDGSLQFAYPRGPEGAHTFMVHFGPDKKLLRIENVLNEKSFERVARGVDEKSDILKKFGPSDSRATASFPSRNEEVWDWRYCDVFGKLARFTVTFDTVSGKVKATASQPEYMGKNRVPSCGNHS